jgi:hypothetical protein
MSRVNVWSLNHFPLQVPHGLLLRYTPSPWQVEHVIFWDPVASHAVQRSCVTTSPFNLKNLPLPWQNLQLGLPGPALVPPFGVLALPAEDISYSALHVVSQCSNDGLGM